MKINQRAFLLVGVMLTLLLVSCKKEAGKGGKLTIRGKVYSKYYNKTFTKIRSEGYAPEEDVYIIFGDDDFYGEDVKTDKDGNFKFEYLQKGNYKVYTYSIDTKTQQKVAVIQEVSITDDKTLDDFVINKEDNSTGIYTIQGKVYVNDYDDTYTFQDGPSYYVMDEDVYLVEEGDSSYSDRVRTNYNGLFEFRGLRPGKYKIYVFSEADKVIIPGGKEAIIKDAEIIDSNLSLTDFTIIKN